MGFGFGGWLKAKREEKQLTQQELGRGLATDGKDASKSVVYGWEKEQHYPRVDQLYLICQKLDCTADSLMFGRQLSGVFTAEATEIADGIDSLRGESRQRVIELCRQALSLAKPKGNPVFGIDTKLRTNH